MLRGRKRKTNDQQADPSPTGKTTRTTDDVRQHQEPSIELSALEQLPTSILIKIIGYVPISQWGSLETIDRNFQQLMDDVWKSLKKIRVFDELMAGISGKYLRGTDNVLIHVAHSKWIGLSQRATNLVDIGRFPTGFYNDHGLDSFLLRFEKLRRLDIDNIYYLHPNDVVRFLADSPARNRLTHFKIAGVKKFGFSIDQNENQTVNGRLADAFANVDESNSLRLESLNLERNDRGLYVGFLTFEFLQTMDITRLTEFFVMDTSVPQSTLSDFFKRATNLERITFSMSCESPSESPCKPIMHDAKSIGTIRDGNAAILEAIGNLEDLESLTIGASTLGGNVNCACRRISREMASLFRRIGGRRRRDSKPIFEELALLGYMCTSDLVAPIADYLPELESLSIDRIDYVDNVALELVLRSQSKLKKLRLNRVDIAHENNGHIRIEDLLQCASTLEHLNISFPNGGYIHGDPNQLAQFRRLKEFQFVARNLTTLDSPIDDSVLSKWADGFGENLIALELGWMSSITLDGLAKLLAKSPRLESFQLHGFEVSDAFLKMIPQLCPLITKFRLMDCHGQTTTGVQAIIDGCDEVHTLNFEISSTDSWEPWKMKWKKYQRISFR